MYLRNRETEPHPLAYASSAAGPEPSQSLEPGTPSGFPTWVSEIQRLGPLPDASPVIY